MFCAQGDAVISGIQITRAERVVVSVRTGIYYSRFRRDQDSRLIVIIDPVNYSVRFGRKDLRENIRALINERSQALSLQLLVIVVIEICRCQDEISPVSFVNDATN